MDNKFLDAKRVSINGIFAALAVILLFFATVLPTSRISLFVLSSFFVSVIILEYGVLNGWTFYIVSSLVAFIVVPSKHELFPYAVFFGLYGIIKFYIEKIDGIVLEYVLKIAFFNVSLTSAVIFVKEFFFEAVRVDFPWLVVILILQVVFVIYDYVYTLFIQWYKNKIRKLLGFS